MVVDVVVVVVVVTVFVVSVFVVVVAVVVAVVLIALPAQHLSMAVGHTMLFTKVPLHSNTSVSTQLPL